jgi:hypothetical protein
MTQGDVREPFSKIYNVCFFIIALFLSQLAVASNSSFGSLNERSALAGVCGEVTLKNIETAHLKDKITAIGIMLHPESLDAGGRHYVPFVRLNFQSTTGVFPLIPDPSEEGKYRLPCDFTKLRLSHIPEQAYPTIELPNLSETELEKLNQEYQAFSNAKEQLQQTLTLANNTLPSDSGEVIAHYFNHLVIVELPIKWFGDPLYPVVSDERQVKSLEVLVSELIRYPELATGEIGNTFKSFKPFDFYLYPNAIKDNNKSAQKLAFRISNNAICSHKNKGCADKMNQTGALEAEAEVQVQAEVQGQKQKQKQAQYISIDAVKEGSEHVEPNQTPAIEKKATDLYSIQLHQQTTIKNSTFIKVFETEDICQKDKPSNFFAEGFAQAETLQKLIRYSGASSAQLPKDKWIYITDTRIKLTKCSQGELRSGEIHFELVKLRSDKPRKLIVWSPRMGFEQKIERVRAATVVRETLKSWIELIYKKQSVLPFTMIIIEPSGAAKVILESEELSYLPAKDAMDIIESIDTAGYSDRALLDLTSVNSLIKSEFDHVLYIVDSRNEAFKIEDVGVALSWKITKKLTIANLGKCQNWFNILGESGFACYSTAELGSGLNKVLEEFF